MKTTKQPRAGRRGEQADPPQPPATAEDLAGELKRQRALEAAWRDDELARDRDAAAHERDRADLVQVKRLAELDRAEREASARADAELARLYRDAKAAGERIRIRSQMARSGEARALGLERHRVLNLRVLVPVLLAFAAWSTTGVQQGAAILMGISNQPPHPPVWWALWLLEPGLIGAVVWIIYTRTRLTACGGDPKAFDADAAWIMWTCLAISIGLNIIAGATGNHPGKGWILVSVVAASIAAHAIGPVGAAGIAHLIGVIDKNISAADPWTEHGKPVPLLSTMNLTLPTTGTDHTHDRNASGKGGESAPVTIWPVLPQGRTTLPIIPKPTPDSAFESVPESASGSIRATTVWPVLPAGRPVLPIVTRPASESAAEGASGSASESTPRSTSHLREQRISKAPQASASGSTRKHPARTRADKGTTLPKSTRKSASEPTPRALTDQQLRARLDERIEARDVELGTDGRPSVRAVQDTLGVGFARAKRIREMTPGEPGEAAA